MAKACRRWLLTVCGDRNNRSATCRFVSPLGDLPHDFELALGQPWPAVPRRDHPGDAAADTEGAKPSPNAGRVPGRTCTVIQLKRLAEHGDTFFPVPAPG